MSVGPTFGRWPPGATLLVPITSDDDVDPNQSGASAFFRQDTNALKLVLPDGSIVSVGPAAPPAPVIAPRIVASVKSNLPDPPTLVYSQGGGLVLNVIQNPITFVYVLTCSIAISDATCAVLTSIKEQTVFQTLVTSFPGGNDLRFQGQAWELDGGGGLSINAVSLDFSFALY